MEETHRYFIKLVVLLLVSVHFCFRNGAYSARAASSFLLQKDVDAVNALLRRANRASWLLNGGKFDKTDCNSKLYINFITCNYTDNGTDLRVTELDFSSQQIEGEMPKEIGNLKELRILYLYDNKFGGRVPSSLGNLTNLEALVLSNNRLEGPIPHFLGAMKSLEYLDLSNNWFNGTIPPQLGGLSSLAYLMLDNNALSGQIPKELGNLTSLQYLTLYDNKLEGQIPDDLGNLTSLEYLYLMNNNISGTLPSNLKGLKNIQFFGVRGNSLSGKFSGDLVLSWPKIRSLSLTGNYFEGPLLLKADPALTIYRLYVSNLLGGEKGFEFPDIKNLTSLRYLTLSNCSLTGRIPDFIWQLRNLTYLDLSFNQLTGGIPASINQNIDTIFLRSNRINQSLPMWLIHKDRSYVDISENFFKNESIPTRNVSQNLNSFSCCSKISNLTEKWQQVDFTCPNETSEYNSLYINCGGEATLVNGSNSYEGDVNLEGASTFYLSDSGRWAYSSMGTLSVATSNLYLFNKTCNVSMLDSQLYQTARVAPISLKYYGLCLKKDEYIVRLHFAEITWDADQVSGFKDRRVFDVEIQREKKLTNFNIEEEAKGVDKNVTKEFKVSLKESRLEIHLYWTGKGSLTWPTPYYGPLISAISVSPVSKKHKKPSAGVIAGISVSVLVLIILSVLLLWEIGIFGGKKDQDLGLELYPGKVYTFQQIKAATENFADANKLGQGGFGSVYKGVLRDGNVIAVKQLSTGSRQGIREFVNEIATISAVRHQNLVKLMGFCVKDNQLLLIYEYMENNSLDHVLFDEQLKSNLDWKTRTKICLDIAKGLAFLHDEKGPKIIHRDIKLTNILLDKDLSAKISDFGFARLYEEDKAHVTRIQGTTGYMAPEYAIRGELTTKADVYSFGVVILEIFSGRNNTIYKPNDEPTEYLLETCIYRRTSINDRISLKKLLIRVCQSILRKKLQPFWS